MTFVYIVLALAAFSLISAWPRWTLLILATLALAVIIGTVTK